MLSRESDKMKIAVLCLALFSTAFALPIAELPSANTLRKPEIEKGSRSAGVHHDASARERTGPAPVAAAPTAVDSISSDENIDKLQQGSRSADVSQDAEAQERTGPAPVAAAPTAVDSFPSDEDIDKLQQDAETVPGHHSTDAQEIATPKLNSDATEDSYAQEDPLLPVANDDSNREEIHFSDADAEEFEPEEDMLFDAANDPEFRDAGFADDTLENELANVDEDTDVLTATVQ
ncbi:uncharacterized protein LOC121930389 isoform X1 [Sceloporus undulatus]|uniref:uncharacterized protein LOC121930389 isoform X1 n=1 Tax=Sceloporus undulatus TaxID=8520 RepID=UPI001C4BA949|nr:uncharacterized protein LOC121930389 isoform X1 [Sceloporus undulatus]